VSLPSLRICLRLALYVGSLYGDVIGLMLLPPSQARLLSVATASRVVCAPHISQLCAVGCRTV
jgi:hypothetical protein